jgi:hypothetical protein
MTMTVGDAGNAMLRASSRFATERTRAWNHNVIVYVKWRTGEAQVGADCFFGKGGVCIYRHITDKQFVQELFSRFHAGESDDLDLQQLLKEDRSAVPYARYYIKQLLEPNIDRAYRAFDASLRQHRPNQSDPPPALVLAAMAAAGRHSRETLKLDSQGWTADDYLGWLIVYQAGELTGNVSNVAALMAEVEIPSTDIAKVPKRIR